MAQHTYNLFTPSTIALVMGFVYLACMLVGAVLGMRDAERRASEYGVSDNGTSFIYDENQLVDDDLPVNTDISSAETQDIRINSIRYDCETGELVMTYKNILGTESEITTA